jgi:hypothetical protein
MKYYNSELDGNSGKALDEKVLTDLLEDVRKSINRSLNKLNETEQIKNSLEDPKIRQTTINISSNNTANIATGIINQAKEELEA